MGESQQNTSQGRAWALATLVFLVVCALWTGALTAFLHSKSAPPYLSEAKLLVRYVLPAGTSPASTSPGPGPMAPLKNELAILTSEDLARRVVQTLGPGTIVPGASEAAEIKALLSRLEVQARSGTNILSLRFRHKDPTSATRILGTFLDQYLQMHLEIHRPAGARMSPTPNIAIIQNPSVAQKAPVVPGWLAIGLAALGLVLGLLFAALAWWLAHRRPPPPAPPSGELAVG